MVVLKFFLSFLTFQTKYYTEPTVISKESFWLRGGDPLLWLPSPLLLLKIVWGHFYGCIGLHSTWGYNAARENVLPGISL